jgi:hypothetical protein
VFDNPLMPLRSTRVPAYAAAVLAFGSAAVSLYWTLGGTVLLDTVGGTFEHLARKSAPLSPSCSGCLWCWSR